MHEKFQQVEIIMCCFLKKNYLRKHDFVDILCRIGMQMKGIACIVFCQRFFNDPRVQAPQNGDEYPDNFVAPKIVSYNNSIKKHSQLQFPCSFQFLLDFLLLFCSPLQCNISLVPVTSQLQNIFSINKRIRSQRYTHRRSSSFTI